MRKIFLDCGANEGESIKRFQKLFSNHQEYDIFCFEPHGKSTKKFDQLPNITVINKAVWTHDGTVNFYLAGASPAGSTLLKDKTTWKVSKTPMEIPCLDLSAWISREFKPKDHIVLKMNIEGAEYEVLEKMLADGTLTMIDKLYISWHFRKIPSITTKRHKKLIKAIKEAGHEILKWWD